MTTTIHWPLPKQWSDVMTTSTGLRDRAEELLPCPFCGGEARRVDFPAVEGEENAGGSCIECIRCGVTTAVHFDRKENLESSWNDRAATEQLDDLHVILAAQDEAGRLANITTARAVERAEKAEAVAERLEQEMLAWRICAQDITPGGSEFMTPEAVRGYQRDLKNRYHAAKCEVVLLQRQLAALSPAEREDSGGLEVTRWIENLIAEIDRCLESDERVIENENRMFSEGAIDKARKEIAFLTRVRKAIVRKAQR